ncbi:MAG: class I SAM-dependent methyltransferase [Deltaproteobacteria bacterium]|nr:class I SAM-dependent methyltransferase [Deltaproteobacteria bacterium]
MKRIVSKGLTITGYLLQWLPEKICVAGIAALSWMLASGRESSKGLKLLLMFENKLYQLTSKLACDYGNGIHPKHRLMKYHDFFVHHLKEGDKVIDIGCGNGSLSYDLAELGGAHVTGIELNSDSLEVAKIKFPHNNIRYVHGDVLKELPDEEFDVAVMSNVLEHLSNRVIFLKEVQQRLRPKKWLLRVPIYERDWRVPLMDELGVDYRLDSTHHIEYVEKDFIGELKAAGLIIVDKKVGWGEIWCEAHPYEI